MHHYRDSRGNEVDIVLEAPDGPVVGIEVKAAGTVRPETSEGSAPYETTSAIASSPDSSSTPANARRPWANGSWHYRWTRYG